MHDLVELELPVLGGVVDETSALVLRNVNGHVLCKEEIKVRPDNPKELDSEIFVKSDDEGELIDLQN